MTDAVMRRVFMCVALVLGTVVLFGCGETATETAAPSAAQSAPPTSTLNAAEVRENFTKEDWEYPIYLIDCDASGTKPNGCYGKVNPVMYKSIPTSEISKSWNICVSFPHLKDPYWVSANYGLVQEAKRGGVKMTTYAASGYTDLPTQVNQLQNCVAGGAEAIILGGISYSGLDSQIEQYKKQGIVVIDGWNGINTPKVDSHALIDYYITGQELAKYLLDKAKKEGKTMKVVVMPGPAGAGWSERTALGFKAGVKGKDGVKILGVKYGDTGKDQQLQIAENALQTYPEIDWIVGNAVGAEAAQIAVNRASATDKTKVVSTYLIPSIYDQVKGGEMACSANDQTVAYSRIAMDLAIRKLEKLPASDDHQRIWAMPRPFVICGDAAGPGQNNLEKTFVYEASLFPSGYRSVLNVK